MMAYFTQASSMFMTARYHVLHCLTAPQALTSAPRCVLLTCTCAAWWAEVSDSAKGLLCRHAQPGFTVRLGQMHSLWGALQQCFAVM